MTHHLFMAVIAILQTLRKYILKDIFTTYMDIMFDCCCISSLETNTKTNPLVS